jgi:outer membrane lipoprotein SlyB
MRKLIIVSLAISMLAGCANTGRGSGANYQPIVDRPGFNYDNDLRDCQQHANKVLSATDAAVGGAIAGAIFGALLGAAVGSSNRNNYAAVGALNAGVGAAASAEGGQRGIITRCLSGRGYMVLQ